MKHARISVMREYKKKLWCMLEFLFSENINIKCLDFFIKCFKFSIFEGISILR